MGESALIYTRVSQDRAGGRSLKEQEAESRALCDREGWTVVRVIRDAVGASRHSKGRRDGWRDVLDAIASGEINVLVTWEASRAQRDLDAYNELRKVCADHDVKWSYGGKTHDLTTGRGRFDTGLDSLLAEREAEETRDRVRRAMRANAEQGRPHGKKPFGYMRTYDPVTKLLVEQSADPEQAPIVRRMFQLYLEGLGIRTIAITLNTEGITTRSGCKWQDGQVRRVLSNPVYAARRVHQGEHFGPGNWEPLVDEATFDRVQERLARATEGQTRQTKTARLLTGVARCGRCGSRRVQVGHDRKNRKVYQCRECFISRDEQKLNQLVTDVLLAWLDRADARSALSSADVVDPNIDRARQRIAESKAKINEAAMACADNKISVSSLSKIEQRLEADIVEQEKVIRSALVPIDVDLPTTNLPEWWNSLSTEVRRGIIKALIAAVVIHPQGKRGSKTFQPELIDIQFRR